MSHVYELAATRILDWFHRAEQDLIGETVATFNGETGVCRDICLDEHHGLCFTFDEAVAIEGQPTDPRRWYPVSTIRRRP